MKKIIIVFLSLFLAACGTQPQPTSAPDPTETPTTVIVMDTPMATVAVPTIQPTFTLVPTLTPFPSKVSSMDGMTQLLVPAGSVYMGGLDVLLENDELPAHHVQLNEFWIDQLEVTNGMYALCVNAGACKLPVKLNSDNRSDYYGNAEFQDYPVVYVTWYDANAYCQWAGRRLPTEAEWERAARGDTLINYPWGNEPPNELYANANNVLSDTSRVGSYPAGMSQFGALDMGGNVWEWVADYYQGNYYANSPAENPTGPENGGQNFLRVIRGGGYQDDLISMRVSNRGYEVGPDPSAQPNTDAYYGKSSVKIGFRCVQSN
jgi:formylglycine-generating enzyme required for sulfatase activity